MLGVFCKSAVGYYRGRSHLASGILRDWECIHVTALGLRLFVKIVLE